MAFLIICAALQFLAGLGVWLGAKSAIHEILGALLIGFSLLTFGLCMLLREVRQTNKLLSKLQGE